MGYRYIAITDHSQSLKIAHGLSTQRLKEKIREGKRLKETLSGIEVLIGAEVDIKNDGTLDYPDTLLKELDIVIGAIHSGFKQKREQITNRIVTAMHNPYLHIIAHPTGRLLGERDPYDVDMDQIIKMAGKTGTALEINAYTQRLDLDDINSLKAKQHGAMIAIGTDSNIRISLAEEMRMLEYSQRLRDHSRAALATSGKSTGRRIFDAAIAGGAKAVGRKTVGIARGAWAVLLSLDHEDVDLAGRHGDLILDCFAFAGTNQMVKDVWSAGRHCVQEGRHFARPEITERYKSVLNQLEDLV